MVVSASWEFRVLSGWRMEMKMRKVREEDRGHRTLPGHFKGQVQGLLFPVHIGTGRVGTQRNSAAEKNNTRTNRPAVHV